MTYLYNLNIEDDAFFFFHFVFSDGPSTYNGILASQV